MKAAKKSRELKILVNSWLPSLLISSGPAVYWVVLPMFRVPLSLDSPSGNTITDLSRLTISTQVACGI